MKTQLNGTFPQNTISYPSTFLAERLHENSNLEMEWLWAAGQVMDVQEQIYCLQRALYINPESWEARRQFDTLARSQEAKAQRLTNTPAPLFWFLSLLQRRFHPGI